MKIAIEANLYIYIFMYFYHSMYNKQGVQLVLDHAVVVDRRNSGNKLLPLIRVNRIEVDRKILSNN